jgi:hypothetical protein
MNEAETIAYELGRSDERLVLEKKTQAMCELVAALLHLVELLVEPDNNERHREFVTMARSLLERMKAGE